MAVIFCGAEPEAPVKHLFVCFHGNHQGQDLTRAISRQEVTARLGDQECEVKTLDNTHLYCEPPEIQPMSVDDSNELPSLKVHGQRTTTTNSWREFCLRQNNKYSFS